MPRKPRLKKERITVVMNGEPIVITLHPPMDSRKAWYAYWNGLSYSKSTGTTHLEDAVKIAESMLRNGGEIITASEFVMSDEDFELIQRVHFTRKSDPDALRRSNKSLTSCLDAMLAFKQITGISRVVSATPDDCARFQREALLKPKSWRLTYPNRRKGDVPLLSPTTVEKWSRGLQAAFERANRNAGKKCVRGVVDENQLLKSNPWQQFTWIEKRKRPIRQFNDHELISILDYFKDRWLLVPIAAVAIKVCFWTWTRVYELVNLKWEDLRVVGKEHHFRIIGKQGIEKWARIPNELYSELASFRSKSQFVLAAYTDQLRFHHLQGANPLFASNVSKEFQPQLLIDWLQARIKNWAEAGGHPHAYPHVFRKTALKRARLGEGRLAEIAVDAKLSASVLVSNYAPDDDELMRQASNRMFVRLIEGLPEQVALRYGYSVQAPSNSPLERARKALEVGDWKLLSDLAAELAKLNSG